MSETKIVIIKLFGFYYTIGTIFLIGFMSGHIIMKPKNSFTKALFDLEGDLIKLSLCLYWPFLLLMLMKVMRKNNEDNK